ncbi:MAG: ABC transporter ATP-binding protein [Vampirovibrionales bacterium]|nr:ABC transporter ATP-binding protein [Vampirovibrionales bacterium]
MAQVTLKNISCAFEGKTVLNDVSLSVNDGEFLVIVGPSGCGKSTLLRIIAGLTPPSSGEVMIGETAVNAVAPKDRDVAMVFQNYALYPHMSVMENLAFALKMRGVNKPEREQRVTQVAEQLQLTELLKRKPGQLSGGQRQRVALGRAIVRNPRVFLMDEPLSNLDANLRQHTRGELAKLHQKLGITTLYVTHDKIEAMTLGQRIAVIHEGKIQQIADPVTIYQSPVNLFVAQFMGTLNKLPAQITPQGLVLTGLNAQPWPLPTQSDGIQAPVGATVQVCFRPESAQLLPEQGFMATPWPPFMLAGTVSRLERHGSENWLEVAIAGEQTITLRIAAHESPALGASVACRVQPEGIRVF